MPESALLPPRSVRNPWSACLGEWRTSSHIYSFHAGSLGCWHECKVVWIPLCWAAKWFGLEAMSPSSRICGQSGLPWYKPNFQGGIGWFRAIFSSEKSPCVIHWTSQHLCRPLLEHFWTPCVQQCTIQSQRCCLRLAAHSTPAATAAPFPCAIL